MRRCVIASVTALFLGLVSLTAARPAAAETWQGQFVGDFLGAPATVVLTLERQGDLFEVSGEVRSGGQVYHFTAEGWSGAGTMVTYPAASGIVHIQLSQRRGGFALRIDPLDGGPIFYFRLA